MGETLNALAAGFTGDPFRHEALFYRGLDGFVEGTKDFVVDGVESGQPVLVIALPDRQDALRSALGDHGESVRFGDMAEVGRNPNAIISVWRDFVDEVPPGTSFRGIGEPIWAGRSADELVECQRHEALLNLAFPDADGVVRCPYDVDALPDDVIAEARRSHPLLVGPRGASQSASFSGTQEIARPFDRPLAPPPADAASFAFDVTGLGDMRAIVTTTAHEMGFEVDRLRDLVIAVNELTTNSVRHGGGGGTLTLWRDGDAIVCEVRDAGHISDPLVGRFRPPVDEPAGRGLWLANALCDLVQVRSFPDGCAVRIRMHRG